MKKIKDFKRIEIDVSPAIGINTGQYDGTGIGTIQQQLNDAIIRKPEGTERIAVHSVEGISGFRVHSLRKETDEEYQARHDKHIKLIETMKENRKNSLLLDIKHLKKELTEKEQVLKSLN